MDDGWSCLRGILRDSEKHRHHLSSHGMAAQILMLEGLLALPSLNTLRV